jgi:hypothetical protein
LQAGTFRAGPCSVLELRFSSMSLGLSRKQL